MTELLNKAFDAATRLPADEQDALARDILATLAADARWDALFADPRSEALLDRLADEALAEVARGAAIDGDPSTVQ